MNAETADYLSEKPDIKSLPYSLRFGLIAALLTAVAAIIIHIMGQEYNRSISSITLLIPVILVFICLSTYKKDNDNRLSFGRGFKTGFVMFVFCALFYIVYFIIYVKVIHPGFIDGLMEMTIGKMEDKGMSDEEVEMAMSFSRKMMTPLVMSVMSFITYSAIGALVALIASAIQKTN